jgi:hypothetical protein
VAEQRGGIAYTPAPLQAGITRKISTDELEIRIVDLDILVGGPLALPSDHHPRQNTKRREMVTGPAGTA